MTNNYKTPQIILDLLAKKGKVIHSSSFLKKTIRTVIYDSFDVDGARQSKYEIYLDFLYPNYQDTIRVRIASVKFQDEDLCRCSEYELIRNIEKYLEDDCIEDTRI